MHPDSHGALKADSTGSRGTLTESELSQPKFEITGLLRREYLSAVKTISNLTYRAAAFVEIGGVTALHTFMTERETQLAVAERKVGIITGCDTGNGQLK